MDRIVNVNDLFTPEQLGAMQQAIDESKIKAKLIERPDHVMGTTEVVVNMHTTHNGTFKKPGHGFNSMELALRKAVAS